MERWIRSERIYEGKIVSLRTGEVQLDDGSKAFREVVEHPGGVGIVPFLGESVMLIRQYRVAIGKEIVEIPAGKLEPNEAPERCGRRELEEETGYRARTMKPIGSVYSSCGILAEKIHLFLALDLEKTEQRLETDEQIELVEMSLEDVRRHLATHRFEDGKTVIGLHALMAYLGEND